LIFGIKEINLITIKTAVISLMPFLGVIIFLPIALTGYPSRYVSIILEKMQQTLTK
jgi:hypothetical protein